MPIEVERTRDNPFEAFGASLKEQRKKLALTQVEAASLMGLNRCTLNRIEAGKQNLTLANLFNIAVALGCEFKDLFNFRMDEYSEYDCPCKHVSVDS